MASICGLAYQRGEMEDVGPYRSIDIDEHSPLGLLDDYDALAIVKRMGQDLRNNLSVGEDLMHTFELLGKILCVKKLKPGIQQYPIYDDILHALRRQEMKRDKTWYARVWLESCLPISFCMHSAPDADYFNPEQHDDIDLINLTAKGLLWMWTERVSRTFRECTPLFISLFTHLSPKIKKAYFYCLMTIMTDSYRRFIEDPRQTRRGAPKPKPGASLKPKTQAQKALTHSLQTRVQKVWYPAFKALRDTCPADADPGLHEEYSAVLEAWLNFGHALDLELQSEEERYFKEVAERQKVDREYCAWEQCAFHLYKPDVPLRTCGGCGQARYCSKQCQAKCVSPNPFFNCLCLLCIRDWKRGGHKTSCKRLKSA
jgi:hypothetical protein